MKEQHSFSSNRHWLNGFVLLVLTVLLWSSALSARALDDTSQATESCDPTAASADSSEGASPALTEVDPGETEEVAPWIPLVAVAACDLKINACNADAQSASADCRGGSTCPNGEWADGECCDAKLSEDLFNCLITCGLNGPDGDYGNCCAPLTGGAPTL